VTVVFEHTHSGENGEGLEAQMARRLKELKELKIERPPRIKLSAKESLKRTKEFDKRKESFIAAVRKSKS
jgi:hypothetical protein